MKKFTTFLSVLALMLVSVGAKAQFVDGADYIIQNVESGKYLGGGNSWGTQASLVEHPQAFTATLSNGAYALDSHQSNGGNSHFLGDGGFVDQTPTAVTLEPAASGTYKLKVGSKYYGTNGNVVALYDADPNATWKVVSTADVLKNAKLNANEQNPVDVTFLIQDANHNRNADHSVWSQTHNGGNYVFAGGGNNANLVNECWRGTFDVNQTIKGIPNGVYQLRAQAITCDYASTGVNLPVLYANDETLPFIVSTKNNAMSDGESLLGAMAQSFLDGKYVTGPLTVTVTDGSLKIGVRGTRTDTWCVWDNFSLELVEYTPLLGEPVFTPADGSKMAADDLTSIKVSYPKAVVEEELGFSVNAEWVLYEDGKEVKSGEGAFDVTGTEVLVEAGVGHTYTLAVYPSIIKPNGYTADTREDECSVQTLTLSELAVAEYEQALDEAYALLEYASEHVGVGVMLYLPAKVAEYQDALATASNLSYRYKIYNDYKEGTALLNYLMCELQPQYPELNQRYLIKQKSSGLYLNADEGVTLSTTPTPVAFHHVEGAKEESRYFMYSTPDREYICYAGTNAWDMTNQSISIEGGKFMIKHHCAYTNSGRDAYYTLVGMNGALGTNASPAAASAIFGDKAESDVNAQWLFEPYAEPDPDAEMVKPVPATTALATDGETIQYLYNAEADAFFFQGNAWGTQASYAATQANMFKISMGATTEITDYADVRGTKKWMNPFIDGQGGIYVDNGTDPNSHAWVITLLEDGAFEITNTVTATDKKVGIDPAEKTNIIQMTNAEGAYTKWYAVSESDFAAYVMARAAYDKWVKENTEINPGDDVTNLASATYVGSTGSYGGLSSAAAEYYKEEPRATGEIMTQTIEDLQNGVYEVTLSVSASFTSGRGFEAAAGEGITEVFANSASEGIEVIDRTWVSEGEQNVVTLEAVVSDGTLKFGVRNVAEGGNWFVIRLDSLVYLSKDVKSALSKQPEATEITTVSSSSTPAAIFSANGARLQSMQKGINIVRMSDGQVKKVFIK